jgi:hypothetical protein
VGRAAAVGALGIGQQTHHHVVISIRRIRRQGLESKDTVIMLDRVEA